MTRWLLLAFALLPVTAYAERGQRITIDTPADLTVAPHAPISPVIYLERCRGGCTVTKSTTNDAQAGLTILPQTPGVHPVTEFLSSDGMPGAAADAEWNALVACVKEVYSPYAVEVTDVKPTSGTYHMAIVAGFPSELGFGEDILGVAPLSPSCQALDNVMSFSFANAHGPTLRVNNLCWTAAQESAHAFGLDHTIKFLDGTSTCNDPMTYQIDCGGTRFFRNAPAKCGEFNERACRCGTTQNSHKKLIDTFGIGTPTYGNPSAAFMAGNDPLSGLVMALAGSRRGVTKVELLVNGFPWASAKGADFALGGQPNPAPYSLVWPPTLPDGISDFAIRAHDDLGAFTDSPPITRTKGAPCTSADTCAQGQRCDAGRCLWDPPTLEVGDACDYAQECKSLSCVGTDPKICSQECNPDEDENTCPAGLSCSELGPGTGVCFPESGGGCCSASRGTPWAGIASSALVLVLVMRRRRRR
jgi:hypothetical protein